MRHYETIFIARPNLPEDEIAALIERNGALIEDAGGTVVQVDRWGLRKLAYPIGKHPQGYYVYTEYGAPPAVVQEMERLFRIDDRVLKYLTVKLDDTFDTTIAAADDDTAAAEGEEETSAAPAATEATSTTAPDQAE